MPTPVGSALVIGATADIGRAINRALATERYALQLAARDAARLEREAQDLRLRSGASVTTHLCDVLHDDGGVSLLATLDELPDIAVCVVGLHDEHAPHDVDAAARVMRTNYLGPALLMGALAERFAARGSGVLVGIGSVAGDRGCGWHYVYGSAKAGFATFLSGLRQRLARSGVHVVTVKCGHVRTRMNAGKNLPESLTTTPEVVAARVLRAVRRRHDVVYVRRIWRLITLAVNAIPEPLFKRLKYLPL